MKLEDLTNLVITEIESAYVSHTQKSSCLRAPVKNDCWFMCMKFEGKTYYRQGDKVLLSDANSVVLIPPGCNYRFYCAEEGRIVSIYFKVEGDWDADEIFLFKTPDSEKVLRAFFDVAEGKRKNMSGVECMYRIYRLLRSVFEYNIKTKYFPSANREKIEPAINYIEQYYDLKITNDMLGQMCGISTQHFRKLFTEIYGISPIAYVLHFRLTKAAKLLQEKKHFSVAQVAQSVGIHDVYYFSKAFKKYMGVSPKNYSRLKTPPLKGEENIQDNNF